jgi:hypothetical protein
MTFSGRRNFRESSHFHFLIETLLVAATTRTSTVTGEEAPTGSNAAPQRRDFGLSLGLMSATSSEIKSLRLLSNLPPCDWSLQ